MHAQSKGYPGGPDPDHLALASAPLSLDRLQAFENGHLADALTCDAAYSGVEGWARIPPHPPHYRPCRCLYTLHLARPFALLPRIYGAPAFPLPCPEGETVRGGGEGWFAR